MSSTVNPFNITKAVDYSDEEINKYWVDIPGGNGFADIVKPKSPMPMIILGGKGSGKTHIMRYFSFNLQKIRYQQNLISSIKQDQYIGVFMRCGGLNSGKFSGQSQTSDAWKNIFSYYIELWLSQLIINIIDDIFHNSKQEVLSEENICKQILNLLDKEIESPPNNFIGVKQLLQKLQKEVDYEVNNCAITGAKISEMRILASPGNLIFGIPKILSSAVDELKDVQFILLIDEYENLLEYQQQYINTLIREREAPVSFRIGARWYGMKTYNTFSGDESLKEGSEYEKIVIDQLLRDRNHDYEKFAKRICVSRLNEAGFAVNEQDLRNINSYFEEFDIDKFFAKLKVKEHRERYSYFINLRNELIKKVEDEKISQIINNLTYNNSPLLERTNVFLFYRAWKDGYDLLASSEKIKEECEAFNAFPTDTRMAHYKILSKYKSDIVDQLHRETREDLPYNGFEKLVKMSAGIPRLLLIMLKHAYRWSIYNGENPFKTNPISENSQHKGLEDAIKWFLDDARVPGPEGKIISDSINRIGKLIHEIRFSDLPPECSLCSFSIDELDISGQIERSLMYLEQYSYLIKVSDGREKNSSVHRVTYQINGLIAPNWELPIYRRGILHLKKEEVAAIFGASEDSEYGRIRLERLQKYNAPFNLVKQRRSEKKIPSQNPPTLF
jgi:hypothetical protein